jgi:hypothetical protein
MSSPFNRFEGVSIFDDKGEVKRLVEKIIEETDPEVVIDRMRKLDFSYIFTLSKKGRGKEVELSRSEIEASSGWKKGDIDETLQKKIERTIAEF